MPLPEKINWIPSDKEKPRPGQKVLAYGLNCLGKGRFVMAQYLPHKTVLSEDFYTDEPAANYDKEADCYWVAEGWREVSVESEIIMMISFDISHWMPLPEKPELSNDTGKSGDKEEREK